MKHSEPSLLFGFIPIQSILIIGTSLIWWWLPIVFYAFVGLMIWLILLPDPPVFWKCLLLWWPAMVCDKPEWMDESE